MKVQIPSTVTTATVDGISVYNESGREDLNRIVSRRLLPHFLTGRIILRARKPRGSGFDRRRGAPPGQTRRSAPHTGRRATSTTSAETSRPAWRLKASRSSSPPHGKRNTAGPRPGRGLPHRGRATRSAWRAAGGGPPPSSRCATSKRAGLLTCTAR